jgi:hypothetical protein
MICLLESGLEELQNAPIIIYCYYSALIHLMICAEEICTLACFFLQSTGPLKSSKHAHHF